MQKRQNQSIFQTLSGKKKTIAFSIFLKTTVTCCGHVSALIGKDGRKALCIHQFLHNFYFATAQCAKGWQWFHINQGCGG